LLLFDPALNKGPPRGLLHLGCIFSPPAGMETTRQFFRDVRMGIRFFFVLKTNENKAPEMMSVK